VSQLDLAWGVPPSDITNVGDASRARRASHRAVVLIEDESLAECSTHTRDEPRANITGVANTSRGARVVVAIEDESKAECSVDDGNDLMGHTSTCDRAVLTDAGSPRDLERSSHAQCGASQILGCFTADESGLIWLESALMRHARACQRAAAPCARRHCDLKRSNRVHAALEVVVRHRQNSLSRA